MPEPAIEHSIAVVIPVYQGEATIEALVGEILACGESEGRTTPGGRPFTIAEIILVWDCGPDASDVVLRRLQANDARVRPVWLSRNYGQHAATLAGMASTTSDWVVTMDEDGQHDPADLPRLLDTALDQQAQVVYGRAANPPPHSAARRAASRTAKWLARRLLSEDGLGDYSSYRLMLGEIARSVAAYSGQGVYLDVAVAWVARRSASCVVTLRPVDRPSGYSWRRLMSHFAKLVVSSGVRPLRFVAAVGIVSALLGFLVAFYVIWRRVVSGAVVEGWTSVIVTVLVVGGVTLLALGILSEYLATAVRMAMGRPPYLIVGDPQDGPLGADRRARRGSEAA